MQAIKVFDFLLKPLRSKHHIYADRYYTSVPLVQKLLENNFNYTGTINVMRKNFPLAIKNSQQLKHRETLWFVNESKDMLVVQWQEKKAKKPVAVVTTAGDANQIVYKKDRDGHDLKKPNHIDKYNRSMNGCDRMDQKISYYGPHARKTVKWWRKIFTWIIEVSQCNAHILFLQVQPQTDINGRQTKPMPLSHFKNELIKELFQLASNDPAWALPATVKKGRKSIEAAPERLSQKPHLVDQRPGTDRQCVYCATQKKKKRSTYFCTACPSKPHLCPAKCFYLYHTVEKL